MNSGAPRKRVRLTHACTRCRERKVRCDDAKPHCSNCVRAGVTCQTIDPRRPERLGVERRPARTVETSQASFATATPLSNEQDNGERQFQERLPALPRFTAGPTSFILTQWLDIALARLHRPLHLAQVYQQHRIGKPAFLNNSLGRGDNAGPDHLADEVPTDGKTSTLFVLLPLPALGPDWHRVFFGENSMQTCLLTSLSRLRKACFPALTFADHASHHVIRAAVTYTLGHLGEIVMLSSADSVQALSMLALLLRACEQHQQARHVILLAVSIAQNLGLHRGVSGPTSSGHEVDVSLANRGDRIWWCVYILERTISFELERPSNIRDNDCDLPWPSLDTTGTQSHELDVFLAAVELARIQGCVIDRLAQSRAAEEDASVSIEEAIRGKIRAIGELDTMLLRWSDGLPNGLRPTEYVFCNMARLPVVAHLALQFYSTSFLLSRHSLIVKPTTIRPALDRYFLSEPYYQRLVSGHNICSNATRSVVGILAHLHDNGAYSLLQTQTSSLLAAYGLAVQIIRQATAVTVRSDVELQETAAALVKRHQSLQSSRGLEDTAEIDATAAVLLELQQLLKKYLGQGNLDQASHQAPSSTASIPQTTTTTTSHDDGSTGYSYEPPLVPQQDGCSHRTNPSHFNTTLPSWDFNLPFNDGAEDDLDWDALAAAFNIS